MELRTVLPDGSENPEKEFDLDVVDQHGNPYTERVVLRVRSISPDERKEVERQCERFVKNPRTRGMERQADADAAASECVRRAVLGWTNVTHKGEPVACTDFAKLNLPSHVKAQVLEAVLDTEAVAAAASFREPSGVL